jgi:hypothetical protein
MVAVPSRKMLAPILLQQLNSIETVVRFGSDLFGI